jgi:hypothetical protein
VSELTTARSFGIWVYSPATWIDSKSKVDAFVTTLLSQGINEVYLSTNFALLESSALPAFLLHLSNHGIAVEALIGKSVWGTPAGHADMLSQLDRITRYNATQPSAQRYRAIHLDVEPWIGTGTSTAWVAPLISSYQTAHAHLAGKGVALTVDMAGSKAANLPLAQRQAITDATDKVALMQYQALLPAVLSRSERFLNGLHSMSTRKVVMAIRAVDFTSPYTTVDAIDRSLLQFAGYRGWALFDYNSLP